MKTSSFLTASLLATALTVSSAFAQSTAPAAAAPAPAKPDAAPTGSDLPPVNHLVYLAKLPSPASLMKEAAAQGLTIARIDRTDDSIIVTYKYADGHTDTTGYTTLDAATTTESPAVAATPAAPAPGTPVTTTVLAGQPAPGYTVVSYQPAPVYYGPRYYYDDPFWAPLALGVGLGFIVGGHGGYYHGGGHYYYHGGWHR